MARAWVCAWLFTCCSLPAMRWVRRIALAGIVWCAGLLAASTLLGGIPLPTPIVVSGLLLALPVFAVTLSAAKRLDGHQ